MIMKNSKDVHKNKRKTKQHRSKTSWLKKTEVLLLCLLILITSDSRIITTLTVKAEEDGNAVFAIASFMPLPDETAQQTVSIGTSVEELLFPDTLIAVGTYEEEHERDSEAEEDEKPEKPEDGDNDFKEPEEGNKDSEEPDDRDNNPEDSEEGDEVSENPDDRDDNSEEPEQGGIEPEQPKDGDNNSGEPEQGDKAPENPESGDNDSTESDQGDQTPGDSNEGEGSFEEPVVEDMTSEKSEGNDTSPEDTKTAEGSIETAEESENSTVYVDILDQMISSAKDKMFLFFGDVSVEETQVAIVPNMSESETNPDVQTLTQTVSINPVTWECISEYDSETAGCYIFTPLLPEGFMLSDETAIPEIVVIVSEQKVQNNMKKTATVRVQEAAPTSGKCGSDVNWSYANGKLTISGSGPMDDFSAGAPWQDYENMIVSVDIGDGVSSIGNYAFFKCSSLKSVEIPNSITSIGTAAFFECASLNAVGIPNASISDLAFNGCSGLSFIELPAAIGTVAASAFRNCPNAFLYYPDSQSALGATKETRANIAYKVVGGETSLNISRVATDLNAIQFPEMVGNCQVFESNWSDYPAIKITHKSYPNHRYVDGRSECAICGYQKAPEITIDYINETLIGFESGKTYSYSVAGVNGTLAADADRKLAIEENWFGKSISIAIQGVGHTTGTTQELSIPLRPNAPAAVTAQGVSVSGNDGKLLNVTSTMEYSTEEDSGYKSITGTIVAGLSPGTYYVRIAAVDNKSFHSLPIEVTVDEHELKPETKPTADIDYLNETLKGLTGGAVYCIGVKGESSEKLTAQTDGIIRLRDPEWFGQALSIFKAGDGINTKESEEQILPIPSRPAAPANTGKKDATSGNIDGALTGVSSTMKYRLAGTNTWTEITGSTVSGLKPGKYEICYKAKPEEKKFASEIVTQIIGSADLKEENTPTAGIDYMNETLTGLIAGATYLINGTEMVAEAGGIIELEEDWLGSTLRIVKVGNYENTSDSKEQKLEIPPRPEAPEGIEAVPVTAGNASGGKLINVDKTMQYRSEEDDEDNWSNVDGNEVTGLSPGIYIVRFKATQTSFSSDETELIVQSAELNSEDKPTAVIDYKKERLTGLRQGKAYTISDQNGISLTDGSIKADKDGSIGIKESWMGVDVQIVKVGNNISTYDSDAQILPIPERPDAPTDVTAVDESGKGKKDGKLINVDDTMEYQKEGAAKWSTTSQTTKLAAGVYYVRYKAIEGKSFCSDSVRCAIAAYELQQESEPGAEISYADECFIGLEPGASYKINKTSVSADELGQIEIKSAWMTGKENGVTIIKKGDGVITSDSVKQSIRVPKRRPAPTGIKAISESEKDKNDGKLTGVNDEMQYRRSGGEWIQIDGDTLEDLEPGKYEIRYTYTGDNFVSASANRTVYAYGKEPKPTEQNKDETSDAEEVDEDQQSSEDEQTSSSQDGGTSGSEGTANVSAGNGSLDKNAEQTTEEVGAAADENITPDEAKDTSDNKFIGTAIADSEDDMNNDKGDHSGNGQNKEDANTLENGSRSENNPENPDQRQYRESGAVYTEYAQNGMSEFYNFVLSLMESNNLIWLAVILAEPIIFLLLLIYAQNRKKRETECQTQQ